MMVNRIFFTVSVSVVEYYYCQSIRCCCCCPLLLLLSVCFIMVDVIVRRFHCCCLSICLTTFLFPANLHRYFIFSPRDVWSGLIQSQGKKALLKTTGEKPKSPNKGFKISLMNPHFTLMILFLDVRSRILLFSYCIVDVSEKVIFETSPQILHAVV